MVGSSSWIKDTLCDEGNIGMSPIPATSTGDIPSVAPEHRQMQPNLKSAQSICRWIEESVRYKPNTKITAWIKDDDKYESYRSYREHIIVVSMQIFEIPDATKSGRELTSIVFTQTWSHLHIQHGGMNLLFEYLRKFILDWERHEMDEWFRIDGKKVHDPHAEPVGIRNAF